MKEELVRVEHGCFQNGDDTYRFDLSIARGECIGIYVDDHLSSGTAYLDIFKGVSRLKHGRAFSCGCRVPAAELERQLVHGSTVVDKYRFCSAELSVEDFLLALGKCVGRAQQKAVRARRAGAEAAALMEQMGLRLPMDLKLAEVTLLDYYRLCVFRAWLQNSALLILDRITEILRARDVDELMRCVRLLLERGTAVLLFDLDEAFMYRCSDRIDVIRDRKTFYRLYPEECVEKLYEILGWKCPSGGLRQSGQYRGRAPVLSISDLTFPGTPPLNVQVCRGEIAFLRDENYSTAQRLRSCFLEDQPWLSGTFRLNGTAYAPGALAGLVGREIGVQLERPERPSGVLFDNLSALDNLNTLLLAKAGKRLVSRRITESIQEEASRWFDREALRRPLRTWPLPQRLRFSYYKWYLLNPALLLCFFPFAGQETAYHEMIVELLVTCAERGMAVWIVSSGIDAICEKTENAEFLKRLRNVN